MRKYYSWVLLILSDKNNTKNYTKIALKNFQSSIFFCKYNIDFQGSCDFSVTNFLSVTLSMESQMQQWIETYFY